MSQEALQVVAAAGFALLAVAAAWVLRLGLTRELAWAALRAAVQLTVVGAIIALVFHVEVLAFAFVAAMLLTAALTSGGRLRVVPGARRRVERADEQEEPDGGAMTAATITGRRLVEGLEDDEGEIEARPVIVAAVIAPPMRMPAAGTAACGVASNAPMSRRNPTAASAGTPIATATRRRSPGTTRSRPPDVRTAVSSMAATITGRRLVEGLEDDEGEIEARLSLGDDAHTALRPVLRRAITTGLVPAIDQTRSVGLVTLPGTFVGLVLGGASPASAARVQLLILLALLAVELFSALIIGRLLLAAVVAPGERVEIPR